ncbi:MAG: D-alanine--poly(phosphoribitol) ligase subunit DltC [Gallicola sp.]|uniref:D-alanine--poly(phosphoribitol) ligase subunit DltC n=1 Tax=Gallicola sp. Sow4_E12 TaxID=3438785 RepID=UPI00184A6CB1|nr:D-alanine--poly(phosphoribitol) ligase subunit DltC [Gallicola sp.]
MEEKVMDILVDITGEESLRENLDTNVFELGLLDSLGVVNLIVELEDELDVIISPTEVAREDFDTPRKIVEVVKNKLEDE